MASKKALVGKSKSRSFSKKTPSYGMGRGSESSMTGMMNRSMKKAKAPKASKRMPSRSMPKKRSSY